MSHTVDTDDVIEVSADGLQVRKSFTTDEFPVPAIKFEIESETDEPVSFRLSEEIPQAFPMDAVGFHPDYHSENWTAFQDNHVEFTGTVGSGENLVTVYGIRIEDESEVAEFLTEPDLVNVDSAGATSSSDADAVDDSTISNIVSEDRNQVVKDMLTGESEGVPGLDEGAGQPSDRTDGDTDPVQADADAVEGDDGIDDEVETEDEEAESDEIHDDETGSDEIELDLDPENVDTIEDDSGAEERDDTPDIDLGFTEDEIPDPPEDPETDDHDVDSDEEADGQTTGEEGDDQTTDEGDEDQPTDEETGDSAEDSDEPKIELDLEAGAAKSDESLGQSQEVGSAVSDDGDGDDTGDIDSVEPTVGSAMTDEPVGDRLVREISEGTLSNESLESLRTALGVEPSGSERARLSHLQSRVEEVAAYATALEEFLDEHEGGATLIEEFKSELSTFEEELETLEHRVGETREDLEDVDSRTSTVESDLDGLNERIDPIESELDTFDENLEEVRSDVESVDDGLSSVETELEELEETVTAVEADVVDITEWRDQLGSMFSD